MSDLEHNLQEQDNLIESPPVEASDAGKRKGKSFLIIAIAVAAVLVLAVIGGGVSLMSRLARYNPTVQPAADANPESYRREEYTEGPEQATEAAEAGEGESTEEDPGSELPEAPGKEPEEPEFLTPYGPVGFYVDDTGRTCFEDEEWITIPGIDVSNWQEEINWQAVAADGIQFVFVRVGLRGYTAEGKLAEDSKFLKNLNGAKAAGLEVGVYFFSQAMTEEEAREEAEYTLKLLNGTRLDLPVFCDWEQTHLDGDRTAGADAAVITAVCNEFCRVIAEGGYQPAIYLNRYLLDYKFDHELYEGYPVWLAQYRDIPYCASDFVWWQYSCTGTVAGIRTDVDLDVRFVTKQSLIDAEQAAYDPMQENGKAEKSEATEDNSAEEAVTTDKTSSDKAKAGA